MNEKKSLGLYIHVPYCLSKCPYCDFYTVSYSKSAAKDYAAAVIRDIPACGERFDTVYFGGGTPALIYPYLSDIISAADIVSGAEITLEANPCLITDGIIKAVRRAGVNRLSLGIQSMNEAELSFLGRRHTPAQAEAAVDRALDAGLTNISADIIIGIKGQKAENLSHTVCTLASLGISHISAYMLKIEENTPFARDNVKAADEDEAAELYLFTVGLLKKLGFKQYEISNFAREGFRSKHNLKYWRCEEYIGIGASAHSYYNGVRYALPPDAEAFIKNELRPAVTDEAPGSAEEQIMLRARLSEGLSAGFLEGLGGGLREKIYERARKLPRELLEISDEGITLTPRGFLVSNAVIAKLLGY